MTRIALQALRKEYAGQVAILDLTLEIADGEFFTLLGPSGCGKTTLLRMIAGFNSIEAGTISFDGTVINDRPASERNIGMVFQNYALFPQMTAAKNVGFGLQTRKIARAEAERRVAEALESVRMGHLKDRLPGQMSGGQQQRVALARALVIQPALLLMDEPLSNLDAKLRVEMRDTIRQAQRDAGITTVYVTHDQEEAMAVSDRIAVMNLGVVQQVGTPAEIYRRPANRFVAEFIGKTNLLERDLVRQDGRALIDLGNGQIIDVTDMINPSASGRVQVSVRPEAVKAASTGLAAEVVDETFLGSHSQVRAQLVSGDIVEFLEFSQRSVLWQRGEKVFLHVDTNLLTFFDAASGMSIMAGAAV
ncbi:MAG: ABC transporter ATP-binding protein [Alphaproteobacteria bacterium]|nr:ABC transporter ATP-binding protein [Alphaproteobacteria bacterium]MBU1562641.1 ABC transporter ATP-binding protein [Alphaproteobacteria bacterium]MBU2303397.1 ABC transporter ATP-binding protein [Alphaproteobacteria bacterium]MBU2366922.1 ABC transporter ATP-binding protein [Alphaproteobacteria bacterium]